MTFKLKSSWQEVSISEYFQYLEILKSSVLTEFNKKIMILALFSGVEDDYFDDLMPKDIEHYYKNLEFLFTTPSADLKDTYVIGNRSYKLIKEVKNLTAGQFIDLDNANSKAETRLFNLSKSLSAVLLPLKLKDHSNELITEKYCETPLEETQDNILNNCSIADAFAVSVFFCQLQAAFANATSLYLQIQLLYQEALALQKLKQLETDPHIPKRLQTKIHQDQTKIVSMLSGHG